MASSTAYRALKGSTHPHPQEYQKLHPTAPGEQVTVTLLLRRKPGNAKLKPEATIAGRGVRPSREAFAATRGADPSELNAVADFARAAGLDVLETDAARRSVIVRGPAATIEKAFNIQLSDYQYSRGTYRSHDGEVNLPSSIADYVEAVVGLTNRKVPATHFSTASAARKRALLDPPNTRPITPAQVAVPARSSGSTRWRLKMVRPAIQSRISRPRWRR